MRSRRGFTLLEVMVAVAILGLALTVILSAQGGLAASNRSAANMGQAVALGRCKMTEIEEHLLKMGYPLIDELEEGVACCEDESTERFTCDTRIEKIELPSMNAVQSGDGGAGEGAETPFGPIGSNAAGGPGLDLSVDGGLQGIGTQLTQQFGGGAGAAGLISMVMGILYPSIKPMYEASIRRVTVTVKWKEGPNARELPIVQFVTNPQQAGFAGGALGPDGGPMDFGGGASSGFGGGSSGLTGAGRGSSTLTPRSRSGGGRR